jgi:hypothetical protein
VTSWLRLPSAVPQPSSNRLKRIVRCICPLIRPRHSHLVSMCHNCRLDFLLGRGSILSFFRASVHLGDCSSTLTLPVDPAGDLSSEELSRSDSNEESLAPYTLAIDTVGLLALCPHSDPYSRRHSQMMWVWVKLSEMEDPWRILSCNVQPAAIISYPFIDAEINSIARSHLLMLCDDLVKY